MRSRILRSERWEKIGAVDDNGKGSSGPEKKTLFSSSTDLSRRASFFLLNPQHHVVCIVSKATHEIEVLLRDCETIRHEVFLLANEMMKILWNESTPVIELPEISLRGWSVRNT